MTASQRKLHGTLVSPTNNNLSLVITDQAGVAKMSNGTGLAPTLAIKWWNQKGQTHRTVKAWCVDDR
jgi:hypothetical protein